MAQAPARFVTMLTSGFYQTAGDIAAALQRLRKTVSEATGLLNSAFEARLAGGEIELASGDLRDGRRALEALRNDAANKCLGLFLRYAASASRKGTAQAALRLADSPQILHCYEM